ncbi:MAG: SH3 domain-containing protein [Chloroflexota bacterium]
MNPRVRRFVGVLIAQLLILVPVFAQSSPRPLNPNAHISWPLPIYLLQGRVQIRGTANLPNMTDYFIEFQPLDENGQSLQTGNDLWYPAVLRSQTPVQEDVLGVWNTALTQDGIYKLRLTVNVSGSDPVYDVVSPVRIENYPLVFETQPTPAVPSNDATATPSPSASAGELGNIVVSVSSANVRVGDSTSFPIITSLRQGDTAVILGQSSRGTHWLKVLLDDGRTGWMASTTFTLQPSDTIDVNKDIPFIIPPTLDPFALTATLAMAMTLTAYVPTVAPPVVDVIPTADSPVNLVAGLDYAINPSACPLLLSCPPNHQSTIYCAQFFMASLDVANLGSQATSQGGSVTITDTRADGTVQGSTTTTFPALAAGQTVNVSTPLTISTWYNENHTLTFVIDPNNEIAESSEADNTRSMQYFLNQGQCP